MWKTSKLIALFLLATVCHWGFATLFSYWGLSVNFMLVFVVAFCSEVRLEVGYPVAFMCGLFLDFFGARLFGNNAFLFTLVACTVYELRERFDFSSFLPQMVSVFLLTCAVGILNSLLLMWFTSSAFWPGVTNLLGSALVGALCAPAVFGVMRWAWTGSASEGRL